MELLHKLLVSAPAPLLPGAPPPDRRATLQPAWGWLRAAPPKKGKGEPFPKPHPLSRLRLRPTTSTPVSEKAGKVKAGSRLAGAWHCSRLRGAVPGGWRIPPTEGRISAPSRAQHRPLSTVRGLELETPAQL